MTDSFFKIQLNRANWIALFEQNKIAEAIKYFEEYKESLNKANFKKSILNMIQEEIQLSNKIFNEKINSKSKQLYENKDYANSILCNKYIFDNEPNNIENIKKYIDNLEKLEQYDLQLKLSVYLLLKNKDAESYKILSNAYEKNKVYKKAIRYYKKHLELSGKKNLDAGDYNIIGCHLFNSYTKKEVIPDDAKNALRFFQIALKLDPENKVYLKNIIVAAMKTKDFQLEKRYWQKYISLGYLSKDDEFSYCASCMKNGDIQTWAKYYDSRFTKTEPTPFPKIEKPIWTGNEDLSDKTLLIHYEQGYGDNFLMFGYIPRIIKLAKKVIYYVQDNTYELLKNNEFGVKIYSKSNKNLKELEYDYYIPCMSLPIALKVNKSNISVGGGYIKANKELVEKYKNKYFKTNKLKVGLAFAGHTSNKKRDIPFNKLLKFDSLNNVQLYCLTKDINDEILKKFRNNRIINIAKEFNNFLDTACAIENTDIIISSDNCILNLAGAMGKRTIGIFNYHYEFRWYDLTGENCGWYKSVKPIVNNAYDNWDLSIDKAIEYIKDIQEERS